MLVDIKTKPSLETIDSLLIFLRTIVILYRNLNYIQKYFCKISKQFEFVNQIYRKSYFFRYELACIFVVSASASIRDMFYLKEILFRIQYVFASFSITLFVCYGNKDLLFFLLTFNFLASNTNDCVSQPGIEYLIYTHPSELLSTYIAIVFYFAVILSSYYFLWNVIDFTKSGLKRSAFVLMNDGMIKTAVVFFLLNIYFLLFLFPSCWNFFESFNQTSDDGTTLKFFFELKVKDYISFFKSLLYTTNVGLVLIFLLWFFFDKQTFRKLLSWKKIYLFFNFVFATIFASGDVLSQILNIAILNFFVELIFLFRIVNLKSKKQIKYFVIQ